MSATTAIERTDQLAAAEGWNARGQHGSRWYSRGEYMVYVDYSSRGTITAGNHGRENVYTRVLGAGKEQQVADILTNGANR